MTSTHDTFPSGPQGHALLRASLHPFDLTNTRLAIEQLTAGVPLSELLAALVRSAERAGDGMLCSVLLLDARGERLQMGAAPSLPDEYNRAVDGLPIGPEVGSCGAAASSGQRVVVEDVRLHRNWVEFRDVAERAGLRACWSEPILSSSKEVLGTFAMYYREPRSPTTKDQELIEGAAQMAAIAIEHDRAERARRQSDARFRMVAERSDEVLYLTSFENGEVLYVNGAYEQVWGRSRELLYENPRDWIQSIHADDRDEVTRRWERQLEGEPFDATYRITRADGAVRWIHDRAFALQDDERGGLLITGIAEDITERREMEQQILQSQKMEVIGNLAGGIAHDFGNVLAGLTGYVDLLLSETDAEDPRRAHLEEMRSGTEHGAALVRQLMGLSRRQPATKQIVDVRALVAGLSGMLSQVIGGGVRLRTRSAPDLGVVEADRAQIEQVLLNLCVNARDAMPEGGELSITSSNAELRPPGRSGDFVMVRVKDGGVGMDDDTRARLFEPFFTTKPAGRGTGLGLSTAYAIVERFGGHIDVDSEVGVGTTFSVYLPRADRLEPARSPHAVGTVLVVEDDQGARGVITRVLRREGYDVSAVESAELALELLADHPRPIGLLLTDVRLPGMSGIDLAIHVREQIGEVDVVFMSALCTTEDEARIAELSDRPLLTKPFEMHELLAVVR